MVQGINCVHFSERSKCKEVSGRASQPKPGGNGQEFGYSLRNAGKSLGRGCDDSMLHQKSVTNCKSCKNYSICGVEWQKK